MKLETLKDLYVEELRDIYDAENQLLRALPRIAKVVSSTPLRSAFEEHAQITDAQIDRLEQIFDRMKTRPSGRKCEAMRGMLEEARDMLGRDVDDDVRDAGLICCAQKVEHYEIAGYGCIRTYAEMLGFEEDAELLQQSLDEEKEADERLSELAKEAINVQALDHETEEA